MSVVTRSLSLNCLTDERTYRLELIERLHDEGLSDSQISEYLNSQNISTPRGGRYYQELVWVTRNKYRKRKSRMGEKSWVISSIDMTLKYK